ncbi:hypothetical protein FHR24_000338 [Wenyingzhuangia heitensis]|uniref:FecR family protein n=1 Tax=Wenyingzhuangia heitensis TaxID=1487859 RepID=A0ABX0U6B8_9FLAO|nr:FecR family protein [Wenyingzhuangia heitensis]NIJ43899.1 hypothetical protein [Wenyingzhuangia heitensis]
MNRLENLFIIAKDLAKSIFKNKDIKPKKIEPFFDDGQSQQIIHRLKNTEEQQHRNYLLKKIDEHKIEDWNKIQNQLYPTSKVRYLKWISGVAAVFMLGLGLSYLYTSKNTSTEIPLVANITSEDITLKLADGNIQIIKANGEGEIVNKKGKVLGSQKGTLLNYKNQLSFNHVQKLMYNELVVPYGKTFQLVLSDGTSVHLNSGTTLKYPVKFIKGKKRQVYLTGEAYFNVAKDKSHPFIVNANNLNVRVLGTQFNVSSYPEDGHIKTVLVEGSVALYDKDKTYKKQNIALLTPGHKAVWGVKNKHITIRKVDTSIYTNWINGEIVFEHIKFKYIIKKLERHYNIKIKNKNKELENQVFTATFTTETLQEVLNSFKANYPFEYIKQGNTITINN